MRNLVLLGKASLKFWLMVITLILCNARRVILIQHSNASELLGF